MEMAPDGVLRSTRGPPPPALPASRPLEQRYAGCAGCKERITPSRFCEEGGELTRRGRSAGAAS